MSLVRAIENLMVLHVSREPLEAHRLEGVSDLASYAYERACYLIPALIGTAEQEEGETIASLVGLSQSVQTLGETDARRELRCNAAAANCATLPRATPRFAGRRSDCCTATAKSTPQRWPGRFAATCWAAGTTARAAPNFSAAF